MVRLPMRTVHAAGHTHTRAHAPTTSSSSTAAAIDTHKHMRIPFPSPVLKDHPSRSIPTICTQQRLRARRRDALAPDFDVRETESAFYLEGELPGIADRSAVRLDWIDRRTLAVDAAIEKLDLEAEWGLLRPIRNSRPSSNSSDADGDDMVVDEELGIVKVSGGLDEDKASRPIVREWLSERRVGHYQRTFTFPTDVDAGAIKARLGQGLLRVLVPKVVRTGVEAKQVDIESCE